MRLSNEKTEKAAQTEELDAGTTSLVETKKNQRHCQWKRKRRGNVQKRLRLVQKNDGIIMYECGQVFSVYEL